jgi:hypothetical protein
MTRDITASVKSASIAENAKLIYFFKFDFSSMKDITGFSDGGSGKTIVACSAHGLSIGDDVVIYGTSSFDGDWELVSPVTSGSFAIQTAYVVGDSSGYLEIPEPVYMTTASSNISWNSLTWLGVGGNLSFSGVGEKADLNSFGIGVTLSGVDLTVPALILGKKYIGRFCTLWKAYVNASGAIISDPYQLYTGLMNGGFDIKESKGDESTPPNAVVELSLTDGGGDVSQIRGTQMNPASHQRWSEDDEFFRNVAGLRRKTVNLKQKQ